MTLKARPLVPDLGKTCILRACRRCPDRFATNDPTRILCDTCLTWDKVCPAVPADDGCCATDGEDECGCKGGAGVTTPAVTRSGALFAWVIIGLALLTFYVVMDLAVRSPLK